jgi:hypothetical protein
MGFLQDMAAKAAGMGDMAELPGIAQRVMLMVDRQDQALEQIAANMGAIGSRLADIDERLSGGISVVSLAQQVAQLQRGQEQAQEQLQHLLRLVQSFCVSLRDVTDAVETLEPEAEHVGDKHTVPGV